MLALMMSSFSMLLLPILQVKFSWFSSLTALFILSLLSSMLLFPPHMYQMMFNHFFYVDFLSLPLITLTFWISALMIMASYFIKIKTQSHKTFLFLILMLNFALCITFSTTNLMMFYIFFEFTLLPTLYIILGWGYQPERLQAGFYLMIYTVLASLPLLINLILIYYTNASLSFLNFMWIPPCNNNLFYLWWAITILAFMVKMPLYTFHLWLPKAHVEAPVAGSMILAGLLLKLGSYGLLRLALMFMFINKMLMPMILSISMWGAIITSTICIRQPDMKSLIAYSSVGHMGLLTAATMTNHPWAWESNLLMMIAHGLCSSALFALANMLYETTQTRNLFLTKGMMTFFPVVSLLWFLASSANMAAPPSLNLFAEIMLLTSVISTSIFIAPLIAMSAFLAAVYSLFLYTATQHGKPSNFMNPLQLFTPRNHLIIIMHLVPLFLLCLKMDLIMNWL